MKMFKKAQGATEYLIILAIVIIIALIVAGVLGFIPGLGGAAGGRTSSTYWATQDVAIIDVGISAAGDDSIIVKNNLKNSITIDSLTVNSVDFSGNETIGAGGSATLSGSHITCTAGDSYSYGVSVQYTDTKTNSTYTLTGDGNNLEGTCAS